MWTTNIKKQLIHNRCIFSNPLVLRKRFLNFLKKNKWLLTDRNQTVSRRFKPNSRTTLIGEQPNPWNLLQLQDVMSRHRGAKRFRRCGLLRNISLLSLAYLLFECNNLSLQHCWITITWLSSLLDLYIFLFKQLYTITLYKVIKR
jgi:hypothetical protein